MEEASPLEEPRRARVIDRRTGPEDAELGVDPFVGDAGVVGDAAARGLAQLFEDLARLAVGKKPFLPQPLRQLDVDAAVLPGIARRIDRLLDMDHPPLRAADDPLLLFLQAAGEDHV